MTAEPIVHPIRFDPQRRAADENLKEAIRSFANFLLEREHALGLRSRARKDKDRAAFRLAAEAVACNLLVAAMVAPRAALAVPRGHAVMWAKSRYSTPVYGQHFLDVLDLLQHREVGLVSAKTGYRFTKSVKKPSTIRATARLKNYLPVDKTNWSMFRRDDDPELIILKSGKEEGESAAVDYRETKKTKRWRRQMTAINALLRDAPVKVAHDSGPLIKYDKEGYLIDPNRRTLCRHFNNRRWDHGGRMFGGFWMNMSRADRFRLLRIDDEPVANVDFEQLFPRLAYVRAQAPHPDGDLYDVIGDGSCRRGWKNLINALLFQEGPMKRWPRDTRNELPGMSLNEALKAIKAKHGPIAHQFGKGLGFRLMHIESEILIAIIADLFKLGIPALPLHDSVLVARSKAERTKALMEHEFKRHTGELRGFASIQESPT